MKISFAHNPAATFSINENNQLSKSKEHSVLPRPLKDAMRQSAQSLKVKTVQQLNSQVPLKVSQAPVANNRYFMKSPELTTVESIIPSKTMPSTI